MRVTFLWSGLILSLPILSSPSSRAKDGYDLWLRYQELPAQCRSTYGKSLRSLVTPENPSPTLAAARTSAVSPPDPVLTKTK
ncbi:MAG: hypothetical protein P8Y45_05265 [Exilibacterium sp.]